MSGKCRNILRRNCVWVCFCKAAGNNFAVVETTKVEIVGKANTAERKTGGKGKAADTEKTAGRTAVDTGKTVGHTVADMAECIVDTIENTNKAERSSRFGTN